MALLRPFFQLAEQIQGALQEVLTPTEAFPKATAAVNKALEIDDTLAEAHATLAHIKFQCERDWTGSAATLEEVIDHYNAFFRRAARGNPPPNLPPIVSSNGLVVDRGFVTAEERAALLAYLRKL